MLQKIRKMIKSDKGFTLIELMVVVVILGILAAIAIPRFVDKTAKAEAAREQADIKIIQTAVDMYYSDKKGNYPSEATTKAAVQTNFGVLVPDYLQAVPNGIEKIYINNKGQVTKIYYNNN